MNDQSPTEQRRRATDTTGNWFAALCSADDRRNDSITIGGLIALVVDCAVFAYDVVINTNEPGLLAFGGSIAAIIGAMGAAKVIRDKTADIVTAARGNGNGNGGTL